jgi:hypothetical protein
MANPGKGRPNQMQGVQGGVNDTSTGKGPVPEAADGAAGSPKGFTGVFSGLDLPNLVQMLAMNAVTGALRLERQGEVGELFFKAGEIVHAACGGLTGAPGFSRILRWESGQIQLQPNVLPPQETIDIPWHALLIQTMAKIEDQKARKEPAEEISALPRPPQAAETLQLNNFFSMTVDWPGILNCMILQVDTGEITRPKVALPKMRQWAELFADLFRRAQGLQVEGKEQGPVMMSVTLERRNWVLIPHQGLLVALEVERGIDLAEIQRRVRLALRQER